VVTYKTIFLPTITYPFTATFLSQTILEKAQSLTTLAILSHIRYNHNMPKAVVYTPTSHGSLGLCHLPTEQGLQKILHVLKHLCAKTLLGTLIDWTIQAHQIQASIAKSILEYTGPIPWTPNCWINNLWNTLHSIQGQIILQQTWMIPPCCIHNRHLMKDFANIGLTTKTLQIINNCRLFLQVTTLAEITNHAGTHLLTKSIYQNHCLPPLHQ